MSRSGCPTLGGGGGGGGDDDDVDGGGNDEHDDDDEDGTGCDAGRLDDDCDDQQGDGDDDDKIAELKRCASEMRFDIQVPFVQVRALALSLTPQTARRTRTREASHCGGTPKNQSRWAGGPSAGQALIPRERAVSPG